MVFMDMFFIGLSALTGSAALFFFVKWQKAQARAHGLELELASAGGVDELKDELHELEASLQEAREKVLRLEAEREKHEAIIGQKELALEQRLKDFEKQREEALQAARASVMQAGQEMSNKLLEDHKRESEAAKKEHVKSQEEAQKKFAEQFTALTQSVAQIQKREDDTRKEVETVMRALTHPAGAGHLSEVGLENSLKNLGLEAGRDFFMQYHSESSEGGSYRPDAVIFLPQDMVMVVDSKASKFWLELAEAEGTEREPEVLKQFVASMQKHLKALSQKQYADEVARMLKKQGRTVGLMFNVMYLPSDAALEKLRRADAGLQEQCEKARIFMAGPASLQGLFSLANQQISAAKRDENQQRIIEQVRDLLANFSTAIGYVDALGKNLQMASKKFDDFAKSVNARVLPKMKTIEKLGVEPTKNKALPQPLKRFDVMEREQVLDGELLEDDSDSGDDKVAKLMNN